MGAGQPAVEEAGAPEAGMGIWGTGVGMGVAWVWGRDEA